ncbi:hypothetical protein QOZ80_5BG0426360 [Eleusine coracana subsp. coracana]|nr:hypothetical protein QOZ80_5BG0426360 [Eleusine coracana subsp. coracana]
MAHDPMSPPWSDLQPELVGLVFLRLPTRADRGRFPAICRQWRYTVQQGHLPLPSPLPWLVLPDGSVFRVPHGETFHLPEGTRYHNSCGEWLIMSRDDDSCFLLNAFTKVTMPLPSLSSYCPFDEPVETVNVRNIGRESHGTWMDLKDKDYISVNALVVCSTQLIAALVAVGAGNLGTVALCRPGAAAWSVNAHEQCRWLSGMVFFQGKLYAIDAGTEDLLAIDIVDEHDNATPRVSRIESIIRRFELRSHSYFIQRTYLLECHGTLLIIRRRLSCRGETLPVFGSRSSVAVAGWNEFEVFEADFGHFSWAKVKTLGNDLALFIGKGCSRAVSVSPYDLSRDCIFFLDDYFDSWKVTSTSCSVYDMKEGKVYSPLPVAPWKSGNVPATWLFSQGKTDMLQKT